MLKENLRAAQMGTSLARLQVQPTVSLRWQFSRQTPTALLPENYMATFLEVRLPFWDGGRKNLDVMEAKAQTKRLEALLEEAKQGIALEVRQAWVKVQESLDQQTLNRTQEAEALGLEKVAETAYRVGKGTILELMEARRRSHSAQVHLLQGEFDTQVAMAEFEHTYVQSPATPSAPKKRGKR